DYRLVLARRLFDRRRFAGTLIESSPGRLADQPLEAASQDFPHHPEVVARHEIGRADVELAILILAEALRSRDDHGADRVAALDVAVVIDLDAAWHLRQPEALGQPAQQLALRRRVGELAPERLARVGERMVDEVLLLAASRHAHLDLVAALAAQGFRQQRTRLDLVRDEDAARTRLVDIE